jgi:hypothetical protein
MNEICCPDLRQPILNGHKINFFYLFFEELFYWLSSFLDDGILSQNNGAFTDRFND